MDLLFISKNRKVTFSITCIVHDLLNLPYVSGYYHFRWRVKNGKGKGTSQKETVKNHVVTWNHEFQSEVTMIIGKDKYLQPSELILQLKQEVNGSKNNEDLGSVTIDLAEYAHKLATTRKYLLQEAKINSAIRVTIKAEMIKEGATFKIPQTSQVESSIDGLRGILEDTRSGSSGSIQNDESKEDGPSRLTSISAVTRITSPDDTQMEFVNKIFQQSSRPNN